jgi:hydrogenase maturation factor
MMNRRTIDVVKVVKIDTVSPATLGALKNMTIIIVAGHTKVVNTITTVIVSTMVIVKFENHIWALGFN